MTKFRCRLFIDDHSYDIIKHTCLVPLQAKNPKMRINPPKADKGTEWPGIGTGRPFLSNRPMRGPMRTQPTRAHTAKNDIIKHSINQHLSHSQGRDAVVLKCFVDCIKCMATKDNTKLSLNYKFSLWDDFISYTCSLYEVFIENKAW